MNVRAEIDAAAEDLGRARQAYDKNPHSDLNYIRLLERKVRFQAALLKSNGIEMEVTK